MGQSQSSEENQWLFSDSDTEEQPNHFKMLKSEMQHQFWITKKTVQRKLGTKEDEHILSSDADLDAKIEVFKSISETSAELNKVVDQYQERLCMLSQEECLFGRFLKDAGKRSKTTGQSITNTGKAMSYSGQQRMCVRVPLLRLQHELQVFRQRAVRDSQMTIQNMERERLEYRAALSWMKSTSTDIDPDTGRGLDKFRTAQAQVRTSKQNFDTLSMDCIQKIDLLAAARCNLFSIALISYMEELKQFSEKTANIFDTISKSLQSTKYDFCVLKELTQHEGEPQEIEEIKTVDKDQSLFFADDYADDEQKLEKQDEPPQSLEKAADARELIKEDNINDTAKMLIEIDQEVDSIFSLLDMPESNVTASGQDAGSSNFWTKMFKSSQERTEEKEEEQQTLLPEPFGAFQFAAPVAAATAKTVGIDELLTPSPLTPLTASLANLSTGAIKKTSTSSSKPAAKSSKPNPWMDLFADLDPLAHPDDFDLCINAGRTNAEQT